MRKPIVGWDLGSAEQGEKAPGTARLIIQQTLALAKIDVGWQWVPTVETRKSPVHDVFNNCKAVLVPGHQISIRNTFRLGKVWREQRCDMGFCSNGLVPLGSLPVVSNFFDASLFEFGKTWIQSGRMKSFLILQALSRLSMRRSRRLFILSNYGRKKLGEYFPSVKDKLIVTPCGCTELPPASPTVPAWAKKLTKPFFLNVGLFSENKNQPRLIDAWVQRQSCDPSWPTLVLIGGCDSKFFVEKIRPRHAKSPRPDEIIMPGRVTDAELRWAYENSHAYLHAAFAEGFGMPIIEAMAAGTAVCCSDTTSMPETAGDAAVYFDPSDSESLCRAVERVRSDEALRLRLKTLGAEQARQFTWRRNAEIVAFEIEGVLREVFKN